MRMIGFSGDGNFSVERLREAFIDLFRSGADENRGNADEMEALLDGIDFSILAQVLHDSSRPVHEFFADDEEDGSFRYVGPELFSYGILLLRLPTRKCRTKVGIIQSSRYLELWLLDDLSFAVTACYEVGYISDRYVTKYCTVKRGDWRENGMDIDFSALAKTMKTLCEQAKRYEFPFYEL